MESREDSLEKERERKEIQYDIFSGFIAGLSETAELPVDFFAILQGWEDLIDEWIENEDIKLSKKFYKHRNKFLNRVRQRQLPQTEGTWYGLDL